MVPDPNEQDVAKISTSLFGASNYFQPQEVLGGHCAIEFILGNQAVCDNSDWRSPLRTKDAYIDKVMKGAANA